MRDKRTQTETQTERQTETGGHRQRQTGGCRQRGRRKTCVTRQVTSGVSLLQDSLEEEDDSDEDNM